MKNQLFIISFVFLVLGPKWLSAQTGCLVPGYPALLVYQIPPNGIYSSQPSLSPPEGCWWTLESYTSNCVGHSKVGVKGTFRLECPLDPYLPVLFIVVLGITLLNLIYPPI